MRSLRYLTFWRRQLAFSALIFLAAEFRLLSLDIQVLSAGDRAKLTFAGTLQGSVRATGPFTNIPGVQSPWEVSLSGGDHGFWRVALNQVVAVSMGMRHTLAIRADGTLWSWGNNSSGELGLGAWSSDAGSMDRTNRPVQVDHNTNWKSAAAGFQHSLALKNDGSLWAWGANHLGQLGIGGNSATNRPTQVGNDSDWVSVAAGDEHSVGVRSDGSLWSWGNNSSGQLGTGTTTSANQPVQVGTRRDWIMASAGRSHTMAIRRDGTLWAWGRNDFGQLGNGTQFGALDPVQVGTSTNWAGVAAGAYHTLAVQSDGTLWAWGLGSDGQLGDGSSGSQARSSVPQQIAGMTGCRLVVAGYHNSGAIRSDGRIWLWGGNEVGQLGNGTNLDSSTPVFLAAQGPWQSLSLGEGHTAALRHDGTLWTWGQNDYGQLGNGSFSYFPSPVKAETDGVWRTLACGTAHSVALREDGSIWAWGQNRFGQLGLGTYQGSDHPLQVGSDVDWRQVAVGDLHTLGLKVDGSLWTWGLNGSGQLGTGKAAGFNISNPRRIDASTDWEIISAGERSTAAIRRDGTLWTWGSNDRDMLGLGTNVSQVYQPAKVGTNANWRAIAVGNLHMVAVRADGSLWTWGYNHWGQLGTGSSATTAPKPRQVGTDINWRSVAAGYGHCMALRDDGTLWAWGRNLDGELGIGSWENTDRPVQVGVSATWTAVGAFERNTVAMQTDGSVWTWGQNPKGQLGIGLVRMTGPVSMEYGLSPRQTILLPPAKAASVGAGHMAAIDRDGNLWTWGDNAFGQAAQPISALPAEIAVESVVSE